MELLLQVAVRWYASSDEYDGEFVNEKGKKTRYQSFKRLAASLDTSVYKLVEKIINHDNSTN